MLERASRHDKVLPGSAHSSVVARVEKRSLHVLLNLHSHLVLLFFLLTYGGDHPPSSNRPMRDRYFNSSGGGRVTQIHIVLAGAPDGAIQRHVALSITYDDNSFPSVFVSSISNRLNFHLFSPFSPNFYRPRISPCIDLSTPAVASNPLPCNAAPS